MAGHFYCPRIRGIKDELVHTARPIGSLGELITVASDIDIRIRQRRAKRDREKRRTRAMTGTATAQSPCVITPFTLPVDEPVAMDVDATRTREEFTR